MKLSQRVLSYWAGNICDGHTAIHTYIHTYNYGKTICPPPFWGDIISTKTLLDNYSLFVVKLSSTFIYVIAGTKEVIYFVNVFPEDLEIPTTMTVSVYIVLIDAPPYYLTFSEGKQLLWLPVCGILFVSQGSGASSIRISWRAKPTYKEVGFF